MALHRFPGIRYTDRQRAEKVAVAFDSEIPADLVRVMIEDVWVTMPIGEWIVACRLVMQSGQPVIGEVRVFPKDPDFWEEGGISMNSQFGRKIPLHWNAELLGLGAQNVPAGGITRTFLRDIPLGEAKKEIGLFVKTARQLPQFKAFFQLFARAMTPAFERQRSEPRRGKPDLFYANLARDYADLVNQGSRRPIAELARRHKTATSQMRDMIREARERQLLGTVKHGVSGGQLMPYAMELLGRAPRGKQSKDQKHKKGGRFGSKRSRKAKG